MKTPLKHAGLALLFAAAVQSAALGYMVLERAHRLESATTVVLKAMPIDPRDLLRGEYVILNYEISQLDLARLPGDDSFERGDNVYVTLASDDAIDASSWRALAVHRSFPKIKSGEAVIRGEVQYVQESRAPTAIPGTSDLSFSPCKDGCRTLAVRYGIESYFVPEGEGKKLENARDSEKLSIIAALDGSGRAAIKGIQVGERITLIEPLF